MLTHYLRTYSVANSALLLSSDHESYHVYGSCGDAIRGPAEHQLSSGTSQDEDEREGHMRKSQSQDKFGNKTQHVVHSERTGVAKTKIKRPASPYHISSMTVFQRDGGKGFTSCKEGEAQKLEEPAADDSESDVSSSDLRAKWFLSTNQWQGFIPLQIPGIDSLCSEEISDTEDHPACADETTDSNEMSSAVSESLEKMKDNHSLFYKIACDISISDTDITKNDGNSNAQTSSRTEEELPIAQSVPDEVTLNEKQESKDTSLHLLSDVNENSLSINENLQDSALETRDRAALNTSASPAKEACVYEEIPLKEGEEGGSERVRETTHGAPVQNSGSAQAPDENAREEHSGAKRTDDTKVDHERSEGPKKCRSFSEESKLTVQERGNNHSITSSGPVFEGGGVIRSASFGKARVTVLRTSL